jgi:Response regulators consisting of a CheY-like receiver domain and a winged-helix DNA-binding domain
MRDGNRILVVDDNAATRYSVRRVLEHHGYSVEEAGTGGEGLEQLARLPFDALVLDVNLPDMSGFDLVRTLRADPATSLLPVVHVSAASIATGDVITGLDAGADAYLVHPVDHGVLLATLRTPNSVAFDKSSLDSFDSKKTMEPISIRITKRLPRNLKTLFDMVILVMEEGQNNSAKAMIIPIRVVLAIIVPSTNNNIKATA